METGFLKMDSGIIRPGSGIRIYRAGQGGPNIMRIIGFIALGLATAAAAQEQPAAAPPAKAVKDIDKVKCHKEAPIGSLVPKRVCTTERTENLNRDEARATFVRPQHLEPK